MPPEKLNLYRQALLSMRARLRREIRGLIEAIPEKINAVGDGSNLPTHLADRDVDGLDADVVIVQNEEGLLDEVDAALERLEAETFGTCTECGGQIADARLEALPYTPHCITCARQLQHAMR